MVEQYAVDKAILNNIFFTMIPAIRQFFTLYFYARKFSSGGKNIPFFNFTEKGGIHIGSLN